MKCPKCSHEMVEGKSHIGGGFSTLFLTGGVSFGNLTFKAANWRDHVVQNTSDVLPAHYCDNCGAVTIETTRCGLSALES
jgi:predicted RNA-binding Zn-ribbon protein involved in translation (DUF1610 family)